MNFEQAKELSFLVKWKVVECFSGPDCWCRIIVPVEPILYSHPESPDIEREYDIVDAGALDEQTAEHIVKLHNDKLKQDRIISDSMSNILTEEPLNKDYGISQ